MQITLYAFFFVRDVIGWTVSILASKLRQNYRMK
jgi:hypothetical protein